MGLRISKTWFLLALSLLASFEAIAETGSSSAALLMKEAESLFGRGEYANAQVKYEKVLKLEPNRYDATLFLGNTYFARKQWDDAIVWFARAAEINPNIELAYRWWGDALMWKRKPLESRDKFIEALVAEPYNSKTHMGLKKWIDYAKANGVQFRISNPTIQPPMDVKGATLALSPDFGKTKGHEAWFGYGMTLGLEKTGTAFEREVKAFKAVIGVARERGYTKNTPGLDPSLATLLHIDDRELLEPYILFTTKNQAIAEQYPAYRDKHRDALRRYWADEVIQLQ